MYNKIISIVVLFFIIIIIFQHKPNKPIKQNFKIDYFGNEIYEDKIIMKHNSGFFSCCSVKLHTIVHFINIKKKLPKIVDSFNQFKWYKKQKSEDITFDYFKNYKNIDIKFAQPINYNQTYQFEKYSNLDYTRLLPLIKKYFSPSDKINRIINQIEKKYNLVYENICVLFYRGNDKNTETKKCSYDEYLKFAYKIQKENPNIFFLIQSDETQFIEFMRNKFPNNSFYFKESAKNCKTCKNI